MMLPRCSPLSIFPANIAVGVIFLIASGAFGIEPVPNPQQADTVHPFPLMIPYLLTPGVDSTSAQDSLGTDSLTAALNPQSYCAAGVRATTPPAIKKFGKVPFDRRIITLTDPVNTLVRCCVDQYGEVIGAEVVRTSAIPLLDEIALRTATRHQVVPGLNIDEYITSSVLFRVTFKPGTESKELPGRYNIGELDFAFVGPDTTMPKLIVAKIVDSLLSDSLLLASSPGVKGKSTQANLDSTPGDRQEGKVPADSSKGSKSDSVVKEADKARLDNRRGNQARPPKSGKQEEPIPDVEAVIQVDQLARITKAERVSYPKEEAKNRLEGTVWVASLIDTKGRAREHRVWKSSGNAKFDQAALQTVPTFRFVAAQRDSQPIMTWLRHKIEFRLTDLE